MNKLKIVKYSIIISIIILVVLITVVLLNRYNIEDKGFVVAEEEYSKDIVNGEVVYTKKEIYYQDYKIIKNCLQTYVNTININSSSYYGYNEENQYVKIVDEETIKENIYNLISKEYIEKNNISIEKIYDYINVIEEDKIIIPIEITDKTETENNTGVKQYAVSALMISANNKKRYNYLYCILNLDNNNYTFSLDPVNSKDDLEKVKIDYVISSIDENYINVFSDVKSTQEQIAVDYFSDYKNILLSDTSLAYNYLDSEYKKQRFENKENFDNYLINNKEMIETIRIEKWNVKEYSNYIQYTCIDQYGMYYIFREYDTLKYSVILDIYTLDLPEFLERYNSANEQGKVALNIQKFIQAINEKNYYYAYNCLADSFKNNYFKTQADFENYAKENFYASNDVTYNSFEKQGDLYTYSVTLTDKQTNEQKNKTFIMKLGERTEFVLSFDR